MRITFARSATKHGVKRSASLHVVERAGVYFTLASRSGERDPRVLFVGDDDVGRPLEVIALALDTGSLLVIHALPLRERFRTQYEEAMKWQSTD